MSDSTLNRGLVLIIPYLLRKIVAALWFNILPIYCSTFYQFTDQHFTSSCFNQSTKYWTRFHNLIGVATCYTQSKLNQVPSFQFCNKIKWHNKCVKFLKKNPLLYHRINKRERKVALAITYLSEYIVKGYYF